MKILVYFAYRNDDDFILQSYDPIAHLVHRHPETQVFVVAMLLFYEFFVLVMSHSFFSMPVHRPIWQWFYNLIVGVQDLKEQNTIFDFEARKRIIHGRLHSRLRWPWAKTVAKWSTWKHQDFVDKRKLYRESPILAKASDKLRLKLLLGLQLVDNVCFQSQVLIGKFLFFLKT